MVADSNIQLSAADRKILRELQNNGRISNVDLANRIGMSPSPCLRRLKRLEEQGVIEGYSARISPKALGYSVEAYAQVRLEHHAKEETNAFRSAILKVKGVVECYAVTGDTDYLIHIVAEDLETYGRFLRDELMNLPNIKDVRTGFVIQAVKNVRELPIDLPTES